jgi:predicted ferric reductase
MLGQFFLARSNKHVRKSLKMKTALRFHKAIGYIFVVVLLVHPFFVVLPKYFEEGVAPMEAFVTIITTFDSLGVVLGLTAWLLLLVLGITSLFRNMLPMKYKTWRAFHGILAVFFIGPSTWHAVDLGRHTDLAMSIYMIVLAISGILLLLRTYFLKSSEKTGGE